MLIKLTIATNCDRVTMHDQSMIDNSTMGEKTKYKYNFFSHSCTFEFRGVGL